MHGLLYGAAELNVCSHREQSLDVSAETRIELLGSANSGRLGPLVKRIVRRHHER